MDSLEQDENKTGKGELLLRLLFLAVLVIAGLFLANFVAFAVLLPFTDFDLGTLAELLSNPTGKENARPMMLFFQATAAVFMFILAPLFFLRYADRSGNGSFLRRSLKADFLRNLMAPIILLAAMPVLGEVILWNQELSLPGFFSDIEFWMRNQEDRLKELTVFLTTFESTPEFLIGLFVIAVLPGIGEELLFRGVLQYQFHKLTGSAHLGIWFTAVLFSAMHLQFLGFFPRLLLGVLFGYLYFWSGSLWPAVLAHFANNAFTLTSVWLYNQGKIEQSGLDTPTDIPTVAVLGSLFFTAGLLFLYKTSGRAGK